MFSLFFFISNSSEAPDVKFVRGDDHDFDVLIFTQRWPITFCVEWMETNPDHICVLPSQKDVWVIHGIWPTHFGSIGPSFCNRSAHFDVHELDPFIKQLEQFWLNIEKGIILSPLQILFFIIEFCHFRKASGVFVAT